MDDVPDHEERLEGNHYFVIFNIITNQHEELLDSHENRSPDVIVALLPVCGVFPSQAWLRGPEGDEDENVRNLTLDGFDCFGRAVWYA
jgi:hypothetical protein